MEFAVQAVTVTGPELRNTQRLASVRVFLYDLEDDVEPKQYHLVGSLAEGLAFLLSDEGKGKVLNIEDPDTRAELSLHRGSSDGDSLTDGGVRVSYQFNLCSIQSEWTVPADAIVTSNGLREVEELVAEKSASAVKVHYGSV